MLSYRSVSLSSIEYSNKWNLHPWEQGVIPTELEESLTRIGVIHPPILQEQNQGEFDVIGGMKRLTFLQSSTTLERVDCLIVKENAPFSFILDLILTDQANSGELSLAEKARFIAIATRVLSADEILEKYLLRLQLKKQHSTIPSLLSILDQDEDIIEEVHGGRLQERMVVEILKLPNKADRLAIVNLFKDLGMGQGKQKKFFNLVRDIAFRNSLPIASYLQHEDITAILCHKDMNVPQKIHHLGNLLKQQLTPLSSQAEEDFFKTVKQLQLPPNHSISHSPFFEKNEVTLSINFKNLSECEQYLHSK